MGKKDPESAALILLLSVFMWVPNNILRVKKMKWSCQISHIEENVVCYYNLLNIVSM